MGLFYLTLAITFLVLVIINLVFGAVNIIFWATNGLQTLLHHENFVERIYGSTYFKWILLADGIWIGVFILFLFSRRQYKMDPNLHFLKYEPLLNPKICVSMHAYNEEQIVEKLVKDFLNQKYVIQVNVIDNHSTDRTVELARNAGANVITKKENKGYGHSWAMGLREALKTDANVIAITDCDGTWNAYDLAKMLPYLDNCDMVIGTRMVQVLTEKGNQNRVLHTWGNIFIAKLLQLKYLNVLHLGSVQMSDVGNTYRIIRREALEKIVDKFFYPGTDEVVRWANADRVQIFTTSIAIENDLRIVEIPLTFNKRVGISKSGAYKTGKALYFGIDFIWYILRS